MARHAHRPDPETVRSEISGAPADLMNPREYPLLAKCLECPATIRASHFYSDNWMRVAYPMTRAADTAS